VLLLHSASLAGTTWDGGGVGTSWGTAANWNPDGLPLFNGTEQIMFGSGITSGAILTLDGTRYIDSLLINAAPAFTIASGTGGTLNLRSGNITRLVVNKMEAHTISAGIVLGDPAGAAAYTGVWDLNGGTAFTVSGNISEAGGSRSLTKTGNSGLTLSGTNSFSGGLTISAGNVYVSANANLGASTGGITLNGGNLYAQGSFTANRALTITATSIVAVNAGYVMELSGLVSGNANLIVPDAGTLILSGSGSNGTGTTSWTRCRSAQHEYHDQRRRLRGLGCGPLRQPRRQRRDARLGGHEFYHQRFSIAAR
jgi:autotransporter-associated beta strand protein